MSWWPFVSRERYMERMTEIAELKQERRELLTQVGVRQVPAPVAQERRVYPYGAAAEAVMAGVSPPLVMKPRVTLAAITQMGTQDARARAETGAESVTALMDKAQARARTTVQGTFKQPPPPIPTQVNEDHADAS